jgi:hypothetical protein
MLERNPVVEAVGLLHRQGRAIAQQADLLQVNQLPVWLARVHSNRSQ